MPRFDLSIRAGAGVRGSLLTCVGPNAAKRAAAGATRPFTTAAHPLDPL